MFDLGWSELLIIGVVALIVIGPKDLPRLFHSLGRFTARARSMAREFSSAMEEAARDSGLDEAGRDLRDLKSLTSKKNLGLDALDKAADSFEKWTPKMPGKPGDLPAGNAGAGKGETGKGESGKSGAPKADADEVTFRTPPKDAAPAPEPTEAAQPVRRSSAKARRASRDHDA